MAAPLIRRLLGFFRGPRQGSLPFGIGFATSLAMCFKRKQFVNTRGALIAATPLIVLSAMAPVMAQPDGVPATSGGVALGATQGGIASEAHIVAPPHYMYVAVTSAGSFLDCGDAMEARQADDAGRDAAPLTCGVTLTETVIIPAASDSARLVIHY